MRQYAVKTQPAWESQVFNKRSKYTSVVQEFTTGLMDNINNDSLFKLVPAAVGVVAEYHQPINGEGVYYAQLNHSQSLPLAKISNPFGAVGRGANNIVGTLAARPHPVRRWFVVAAVTIILIYLGLTTRNTFIPPTITLLSPPPNLITTTATVLVQGVTQSGTSVSINGRQVGVSEGGQFSEVVPLRPGINNVTVVAEKV